MLVFSTAANTAWLTRLRIRIARICFAVSSWTGGSVSTSNSRMVCLSSTPMRSSPRAVSRISLSSRLFLIANFLKLTLDDSLFKSLRVQCQQGTCDCLQCCQLSSIDGRSVLLLKAVEEEPAILEIATGDRPGTRHVSRGQAPVCASCIPVHPGRRRSDPASLHQSACTAPHR